MNRISNLPAHGILFIIPPLQPEAQYRILHKNKFPLFSYHDNWTWYSSYIGFLKLILGRNDPWRQEQERLACNERETPEKRQQ
jgi:hypothetical protein